MYNTNFRTARGELIAVEHVAGAKYRDAWNDRALKPRSEAGKAYLSPDIGPREVIVVSQQR